MIARAGLFLSLLFFQTLTVEADNLYTKTSQEKSHLPWYVIEAVDKELGENVRWKIPNFTFINVDVGCLGAKRITQADVDGDGEEDYAFWATVSLESVKDTRLYLYESSSKQLHVLDHFTGDDVDVPDLAINKEKLPDSDDYPRYREVIPLITDLPRLVVADYCASQSVEWVKSKMGNYVSIDRGC